MWKCFIALFVVFCISASALGGCKYDRNADMCCDKGKKHLDFTGEVILFIPLLQEVPVARHQLLIIRFTG